MKYIIHFFPGWLLGATLLSLAACHKANHSGEPAISSIRLISTSDTNNVTIQYKLDSNDNVLDSTYSAIIVVPFDSVVASGRLSNQYAVVGRNLGTLETITINGVSNPITPGLVTDTLAIFTVASDIPFGSTGAGNFQVQTRGGTASYTWPIQQPPPVITSINPAVGVAGDTMTIQGSLFQGVTRVTFDSTQAQIISADSALIQVIIPAGVVQAYVYVFTPGGTGKSPNPFGFKSIIYVNGLQNGWGSYTGYSTTLNFDNMTNLLPGEFSNISVTFNPAVNAYGALQIGYGGVTLTPSVLGLTQLKFSVYGGAGVPAGGLPAQVVMNGNYSGSAEYELTIMPGLWQTFTVPLSAEGNPSPITEFVLQGLNVPVCTIYVTDIGFI